MSLEERISRLEERLAELLIKQATVNEQYEALLDRLAHIEAKNAANEAQLAQTQARLHNFADMLGIAPDELDTPKPFNLTLWVKGILKKQTN